MSLRPSAMLLCLASCTMCGDIEASVPARPQSERASERVMLGGRGEFRLVEEPHGLEERDRFYPDITWKPELAESVRGFRPVPGLVALYRGLDTLFTVYDHTSCVNDQCERGRVDAALPFWVARVRPRELVVWNAGRYRILQTASQLRRELGGYESDGWCGLPVPVTRDAAPSGRGPARPLEEAFDVFRTVDGGAWTVVVHDEYDPGGMAQLVSADGLRSPVFSFIENPPYCSHFVSLGEDGTRFAARVRFSHSALAYPSEGLGVLWQWVLYERHGEALRPTGAIDEARCWFFYQDRGTAEVRREVTFTPGGTDVGETQVVESPGTEGPWLFSESGPDPEAINSEEQPVLVRLRSLWALTYTSTKARHVRLMRGSA